jgi:hypothetical protein
MPVRLVYTSGLEYFRHKLSSFSLEFIKRKVTTKKRGIMTIMSCLFRKKYIIVTINMQYL